MDTNFYKKFVISSPDAIKIFLSLDKNAQDNILNLIYTKRLEGYFNLLINSYSDNSEELSKLKEKINPTYKFNSVQTLLHYNFSHEISRILIKKNISYCLLKGSALIGDTSSISERLMRDIDILVRPESVSEVIDILEEKGFKPPKNTFKHFNKVRKSNNKYNFILQNKMGMTVEIHYRIFKNSKRLQCNLSKEILKTKILNKMGLYVPKPELMIIHIIYHGIKKELFNAGPIILIDLQNIFRNQKIEKKLLYKYAKMFNLFNELSLCIHLISYSNGENLDDKDLAKFSQETIIDSYDLLISEEINVEIFNFFKINKKGKD